MKDDSFWEGLGLPQQKQANKSLSRWFCNLIATVNLCYGLNKGSEEPGCHKVSQEAGLTVTMVMALRSLFGFETLDCPEGKQTGGKYHMTVMQQCVLNNAVPGIYNPTLWQHLTFKGIIQIFLSWFTVELSADLTHVCLIFINVSIWSFNHQV